MKTNEMAFRRQIMIDQQLKAREINDPQVLKVMSELPRERFVLPEYRENTYDDGALPIGWEQTISQPYMVGLMTQSLCVEPNHRVLEIGTGSGYQTAVLAKLAKEVFTVERIRELAEQAKKLLMKLDFTNIYFKIDDGTLGWREKSPFDRIIVTAGAPHPPTSLVDQLADNGIMIIPIGSQDEQTLIRIHRTGKTLTRTPILPCRFVKLLGEQAWHEDES
jgi:protein-L-isoaspartate(D-aspartate) O-methyltransferase